MKKLILLFLLIVISNPVYSQVQAGDYIKDPYLNKFVGTWQWTSGQDTLTIIFKERKVYFKEVDVHVDMILGWYKYVEGGTAINNNLDKAGLSVRGSYMGGSTVDNNPYKLRLTFRDPNRYKDVGATFKILRTLPNRAIFKLTFNEGLYVNPPVNQYKNIIKIPVPSTWQMKRIE